MQFETAAFGLVAMLVPSIAGVAHALIRQRAERQRREFIERVINH